MLLDWLRPRGRWLAGSFAATLAAGAWMEQAHQPRVVPLELAFTTARAEPILATWDLARGATYLGRDYAFLAAYGVLGAALAGAAADRHRRRSGPRSAAAGRVVVWLAPAAAACDAVENAFLLRMVAEARTGGIGNDALAPLAGTAATAKFGLLLAGAAYVVSAWVAPPVRS